jgi:hypothetical protein
VRSRPLALHERACGTGRLAGVVFRGHRHVIAPCGSRLWRARGWERWQNGFENITNGGARGREFLSLRLKAAECSGRPYAQARRRNASEAETRAAGANGRVSETQRLSGRGTSSNPGRTECGGFAERSLREAGSEVGVKAVALSPRGDQCVPRNWIRLAGKPIKGTGK